MKGVCLPFIVLVVMMLIIGCTEKMSSGLPILTGAVEESGGLY